MRGEKMRLDRRQLVWRALALAALAGGAVAEEDEGGVPNTFISPCGKPFRAPAGAPYPVADWFKAADKDGDKRLTHAEFVADAEAFFDVLDQNGDGFLSHHEVAVYEQKVCPEVLGGHYDAAAGAARLWLAQVERPGPIDPGGEPEEVPPSHPKGLDETGQGAAPYSFFDEPEPVLAADLDLTGVISKANFLKLANTHFKSLDQAGDGYLTLDDLPRTQAQILLEGAHPRRKRKG
jgi:hypothetical protein